MILPIRGDLARIRRACSSTVRAGRCTACETVPQALLTVDGQRPANKKENTANEMNHRAAMLDRRGGRAASSSMLSREVLSKDMGACLGKSSSSSPATGLYFCRCPNNAIMKRARWPLLQECSGRTNCQRCVSKSLDSMKLSARGGS